MRAHACACCCQLGGRQKGDWCTLNGARRKGSRAGSPAIWHEDDLLRPIRALLQAGAVLDELVVDRNGPDLLQESGMGSKWC